MEGFAFKETEAVCKQITRFGGARSFAIGAKHGSNQTLVTPLGGGYQTITGFVRMARFKTIDAIVTTFRASSPISNE